MVRRGSYRRPSGSFFFFIAGVICVFMLLFADSGERAIVQAVLIGSVVAVIGVTLFLIRFLDDPVKAGYGALQPVAMERTLGVLARERRLVGQSGPLPCDGSGAPARRAAPIIPIGRCRTAGSARSFTG